MEQFDQLVVRASVNPLTDQMFRSRVERLAHLDVNVAVHGDLHVDRDLVGLLGRGQQHGCFVFGEHLTWAGADSAVDALSGLLGAPGLGAGLRVGQIHEFLTGEEVSAYVLHYPLDAGLVLG